MMKIKVDTIPRGVATLASFYRERASQTYNAFWYFVGSTLAEIPYCFMSSLIFTVIFYQSWDSKASSPSSCSG
ncbi:hypothetical protein F443_22745 [Phytophthora nicotianae P1569]|uniref:ABC-2 type transporter transmembrane domain-containing protein n=1 Tax=Phytophthora nicotianae P1569 TaxID=1317065 RepID=V9DTE7_PHYNI|nr:hypothetical protein F443_22745 [Phytophthora nicotianae P1569]